ncbi:uncharacterized protein [Euphorbia lathyris]|uniref:uncharacterized protein n=1 Tax=Euphorbia lathyris TaxID=212925 RepID=UPI0033131881
MVLGLRSKNRKGNSVEVVYLIHIQEIKPWPPSQSLKSAESLLLQWENGDQSSGSFTSNVKDGKIEFGESFKLPVTLYKESSRKGTSRETFQKNYLEFSLCEPRKDRAMKGQLLGSAVINLADYGIIKENITLSCPINCKKSSKSMSQPVLYVNVQPFDRENTSLSKEVSLDKDGSESVSEVTNENDDENEIASFTDDDIDDNVSSHSSKTVSSYALESTRGSPGQDEKILPVSANSEIKRVNGDPTLPSSVPSSDLQNSVDDHVPKVMASDYYGQVNKNSDHVYLELSPTNANRKNGKDDKSEPKTAATSNLDVKKEQKDNGKHEEFMLDEKHTLEDEQLIDKLPQEAVGRQVQLRSNTLASNRMANGVQGNTRRDKLKQLKSVQLQFNVAENEEPINNIQIMKKTKKIDITENVHKGGPNYVPNGRQKTTNNQSENKVQLKSEVEISSASANKIQNMEKANEIDIHKVGGSSAQYEEAKKPSSFSGSKVELGSKVGMLEEELMEAAVVEVGLYSVVAEHGSSTNKVHAPARRLSRFYLHVCKGRSPVKSASAARTIISGLVLVSKACGNDVTRLTFWLSNSIVLRAIVSQVVEKFQFAAGQSVEENVGRKSRNKSSTYGDNGTSKTSSDDWEEPQTFILALERVEAWIFSRIVESVWWQTLTPYMQSTAIKGGSSSKKIHTRKYGLGDQEQGNFAIDLWKKAFRDACERLCPIRACGHECGCLPVLSRLVMEQLVHRLDVAMFNAILRESADEMPTDPVSDPISDPKVLPIPAGKSSFGAGAQLKNAVGNWSRWLTDLFGIDDEEPESNSLERENSFKAFHLLHALSDLMMLPFDMLADRSTRKEVCPAFGAQIIERVLSSFVPDEFNPDPIPDSVFDSLDSEDLPEDGKESITSIPCTAAPTIYTPPSTASLRNMIGEVENESSQISGSALLRKSYTSDDELDEIDSPMSSIIIDNSRVSPTSPASNWMPKGNGGRKVVRYQLLRQVWKEG